MKNKILIAFGIIAVLLVSGCTKYIEENGSGNEKIEPDIASPLKAKLEFSENPLLNKDVKLMLRINSFYNSPAEAKIELPNGFELVSGNLNWNGDLAANEEQILEITVKSTEQGYYMIKGTAQLKSYNMEEAEDRIYLEVTDNDAIIGNKLENKWYIKDDGSVVSIAIPFSQNNENIQSELIISENPVLGKEFTATYRLTALEDLSDSEYTQMSLSFPPNAFEIISFDAPEDGVVYEDEMQLSWKGKIRQGQTLEIKARFKVINEGEGQVYGHLNVQPGGDVEFINDVKIADIYVDKYRGYYELRQS